MSSITATRTGRFTPPPPPSRKQLPKPTRGRHTVGQAEPSGRGAMVGRSDRPVLRIVASRPTSAAPAERARPLGWAPSVELVESPLRPVDLADFFAAEYDGDDVSVEVVRRRPSALRLTRRGRVVVLVAGFAAALGLGFVAATGSLANDKPAPTQVVTVQPGQTLWSIASGVSSGGDVRATMSHLEAINHLHSPTLQVGQQLRVPR